MCMKLRSCGVFAAAMGVLLVAGVARAERQPATGPGARTGPAMVALDDGDFLLFGGKAADGTVLGDTWLGQVQNETYYPNRVGFTLLAQQGPPARYDAAIASDDRGRVYLHGGFDAAGNVLDDTWVWHRGNWTLTDRDPEFARAGHQMLIVEDRIVRPNEHGRRHNRSSHIIMFGGVDGAGNALHDTVRGTIRRVQRTIFVDLERINMSGPSARSHFTLVMSENGHRRWRDQRHRRRGTEIVLFGGLDGAGNPLGDTWRYFADADRWEQEANSGPAPRFGQSMVYDKHSRRFILFGGTNGADTYGDTWALKVINRRPPYAPTVQWVHLADMGPMPRCCAGMAYDEDWDVSVLFGGTDATGAAIEDVPAALYKAAENRRPGFWTNQVPAER